MADAVMRYRAAWEADDIDTLMETLAPDAELVSPISGRMVFHGKDDLRVLLSAILRCLKDRRRTALLGSGDTYVVTSEARVAGVRLGDALVFELDEDGSIRRIRPYIRPWLALTVLTINLMPRLMRHPGVILRALRRS
jgi:hypothetical protein